MKKYLYISTLDIYYYLVAAQSYLKDTEEFIETQIRKHQGIVESYEHIEWGKDSLGLEEPPAEAIEADNKLEFAEQYPYILRSSLFLHLFSYFESTLMEECKQNQKLRGDSFLNDKDSVLDRIRKYFLKNLGSNHDFVTSEEWLTIKKYQMVRHCLTHADGKLSQLKKEEDVKTTEKFAEKNPKIMSVVSFDGQTQILIERGFCESFIALLEKLFDDINNAGRNI